MSWHARVYQPPEDSGLSKEEWTALRMMILRRDNFTCLRCDKQLYQKRLSAHHIVPKAEGGSNDLTNLVTLCHDCHDYVEINNLKNRAEIMGSIESEKKESENEIQDTDRKDKPDWRTWVYGGLRRPK